MVKIQYAENHKSKKKDFKQEKPSLKIFWNRINKLITDNTRLEKMRIKSFRSFNSIFSDVRLTYALLSLGNSNLFLRGYIIYQLLWCANLSCSTSSLTLSFLNQQFFLANILYPCVCVYMCVCV